MTNTEQPTVGVIMQMQPAALRAEAAAAYLSIGVSKFHELVADGALPQPIKIGRASLWRRVELDTALAAFADESAPSVWDDDEEGAA